MKHKERFSNQENERLKDFVEELRSESQLYLLQQATGMEEDRKKSEKERIRRADSRASRNIRDRFMDGLTQYYNSVKIGKHKQVKEHSKYFTNYIILTRIQQRSISYPASPLI